MGKERQAGGFLYKYSGAENLQRLEDWVRRMSQRHHGHHEWLWPLGSREGARGRDGSLVVCRRIFHVCGLSGDLETGDDLDWMDLTRGRGQRVLMPILPPGCRRCHVRGQELVLYACEANTPEVRRTKRSL